MNSKKLRRIPNSFICKCGHKKADHKFCGPPIGAEWCEGAGLPKNVGWAKACACYFFDPDNLKYLYMLYKRGKKK